MNRRSAQSYHLPQFVERTTTGVHTTDPYSKLFEQRIIFLGTHLDDVAANDVIAQFLHLEYAAPDQDISLYINSPGTPGESISAMAAIYDTMQVVTCDVETICLGQAVSTAAVLLAAGAPGKRLSLPGARMIVQQPLLDETYHGQPSDLMIKAAEMLGLRDLLTRILARHTGQDVERITADIEREKIFDAEGAKAYGLVDHVVTNRKSSLNFTGTVGR